MTNIAILQWFLIIWLLTILAKSIFEIFDKEPPSGLFFGLILIVVGCFWFLNLKNSVLLNSWISGFYVSGLIGIILISGGIRILLKTPLRAYVAVLVIFGLSVSLFIYGPTQKNNPSFFDFLNQTKPGHFWNKQWLQDSSLNTTFSDEYQFFGTPKKRDLSLVINKVNLLLSTSNIDYQFGLKGAFEIDQRKFNSIQIESKSNQDLELVVNPDLKELEIELTTGNISGSTKNSWDKLKLHSETGNINLTMNLYSKVLYISSQLGNVSLYLYDLVEEISIDSNIGNIEIHVKKGTMLNIEKTESRMGKIIIPSEIGSLNGKSKLRLTTDIGNISIFNDL
jgi:hypothetical protein